jgi:hypothetical protein
MFLADQVLLPFYSDPSKGRLFILPFYIGFRDATFTVVHAPSNEKCCFGALRAAAHTSHAKVRALRHRHSRVVGQMFSTN